MSDELAFKTRHEFTESRQWGEVSPRLRQILMVRASTRDRLYGVSGATAVAHAGRCTLLLWVAGGHWPAPYQEVATATAAAAGSSLEVRENSPTQQVKKVVSWLEEQWTSGLLKNLYVTASLVLVVDDHEVWVWHTSPHGVMCGPLDCLQVGSTDLRRPMLRALRVVRASSAWTSSDPDAEVMANMSSIFCVGTLDGYEELRCDVGRDQAVLVFDRASLPFGPFSEEPIPMAAVWSRDAGWKHGLAARAVAIGAIEVEELLLPDGWQFEELPIED